MSAPASGDLVAGRYRLVEELGVGGMGVVFRARDEQVGRDVAIKILRATTPDASRRLQREARATQGVDPERIAQVHEVGETPGGDAFLVMEYVEGRTLRAILRSGGVDRPEALRILREVATTLAQAHASGLVHRDVKPDNIMVRSDRRVILLDFGIVKHLDRSDDVAHVTTQLTSEGTMIGTPAYLAPEQALGRDVGPAVDQFALAVTAFELLTGKLPWSGTEVTRMLAQLLADTPPPASTMNPGVPREFDAVLWRALSKSPAARFPSVEAFVEALEAAERGETMPSPASQTVEGPVASAIVTAREIPAHHPKPRRRSLQVAGLLTGLVAMAGAFVFLRSRPITARTDGRGVSAPAKLVVSSELPLACPVFAVEGVADLAPRLGAAAASLACARAKWYLGGSDEKVLVPAALLGVPVQPRQGVTNVFGSADARAHTLEITKAKGLPWLEGTVARSSDSWRVDLVVRAPGGAEIARVAGVEGTYLEPAIKDAVTKLWHTSPLEISAIDPDVARWTAYPDVDAGLLELDLTQAGSGDKACAEIRERGGALGLAYYYLSYFCPSAGPLQDASALVVDESSRSALVTSANAILNTAPETISDAEARRIALEVESMRSSETSRFGRAALGRLGGMLWDALNERERAYAITLSALGDDPLFESAWHQLVFSAAGTGSAETVRWLASAWFPQEPAFLTYAAKRQSDVLAERLLDDELAYILEPTAIRTLSLGRTLAEAGRAEEVRALAAATPIDLAAPDPDGSAVLLASIDLHDAMLSRALERLEGARETGIADLPVLASVLGRTEATAQKWATSFMQLPEREAYEIARRRAATIALCMSAGAALAARCLSRVEKGGQAERSAWGVGGDLLLRGAKRFAAGDVRAAVDIWRPLVSGPNDALVLLLPTAAFDRAGEPDLAARIDARKMHYRQFAGVSEAAPREARRAFERGDRARAKELATAVVKAWEVADATIPAVAEMRALLAKMGD